MRQGIFDIKDVPVSPELSDKHLIQIEAHRTGRPYVNAPAIRDFLAELRYPLYFLDFETIAPAIPIYDLTRPYEDVPFQFSLHVIEKEGKKPVHYSYLALGKVDPRLELLKRLQDLLGQKGTIVAYNATYELKCLRYAVRAYPKFAKWYKEIEARFVDLLIPFSNFFYYHPAQLGSASMKEVLPALTKISYKDLKISGGGMARLEYMRATYEPNIEPADHAAVFAALEQYCELDTKGMIDILDALRKYV
jgi:hypothetical protein